MEGNRAKLGCLAAIVVFGVAAVVGGVAILVNTKPRPHNVKTPPESWNVVDVCWYLIGDKATGLGAIPFSEP